MAILNLEGFSGFALSVFKKQTGRQAPKTGECVTIRSEKWPDGPRVYRAQWFGTPENGMRLYWHRVDTPTPAQPAAPQPAAPSTDPAAAAATGGEYWNTH